MTYTTPATGRAPGVLADPSTLAKGDRIVARAKAGNVLHVQTLTDDPKPRESGGVSMGVRYPAGYASPGAGVATRRGLRFAGPGEAVELACSWCKRPAAGYVEHDDHDARYPSCESHGLDREASPLWDGSAYHEADQA